jgi:hypothetical protein
MSKPHLEHLKKIQRNTAINARPNSEVFDNSWSEVEGMYETMSLSLIDVSVSVNEHIKILNLNNAYQNNVELVTTVNGLTRDLEAFSKSLIAIKERHSGYNGAIVNDDELALCIDVFNEYVSLFDVFKNITFLPLLTITEFLMSAKDLILQQPTTEQ